MVEEVGNGSLMGINLITLVILKELGTHFLENSIGGTQIAFENFVKFGCGVIMHHGSYMIDEYLYIGIMHVILEGAYFSIFDLDNDLPLCEVGDAIVICL